jgi:hypothetical protein
MPQLPFRLHAEEAQQRPQSLAGTGPGMHQHIAAGRAGGIEATSQQLDQLLLPEPRPDVRTASELKRG